MYLATDLFAPDRHLLYVVGARTSPDSWRHRPTYTEYDRFRLDADLSADHL